VLRSSWVCFLLCARCGWYAYYTILVLFLRKYTLVTTIVQAEGKKENASNDLEKGPGSEETGEREEKEVKEEDVKEEELVTEGRLGGSLEK
jgi:hypothetical protein